MQRNMVGFVMEGHIIYIIMYLRRISIGVHYSAGDFPVTVDFTRFAPGSHRLLLNVTSTGGEIATREVGFNVPAPLGKYHCIHIHGIHDWADRQSAIH